MARLIITILNVQAIRQVVKTGFYLMQQALD